MVNPCNLWKCHLGSAILRMLEVSYKKCFQASSIHIQNLYFQFLKLLYILKTYRATTFHFEDRIRYPTQLRKLNWRPLLFGESPLIYLKWVSRLLHEDFMQKFTRQEVIDWLVWPVFNKWLSILYQCRLSRALGIFYFDELWQCSRRGIQPQKSEETAILLWPRDL